MAQDAGYTAVSDFRDDRAKRLGDNTFFYNLSRVNRPIKPDNHPPTTWRLVFHPRNWPVLVGIALIRLLILLPLRVQRSLGVALGRLFEIVGARRRRVADINLRLCFPELDQEQRDQLRRAHFANLGIGLFETAQAWWASNRRLRGLATVEGLEHLAQARAGGRGILLLTAHFTGLEIGARFITFHHAFHAMYRPHKNALYQSIMQACREQRSGRSPIAQNDIRATLRALRAGETVWYAPDHNYGRQSIFVPFFGVPAYTITATARLAEMGNAVVLPYYSIRQPDGRYRVIIEPVLENFPSGDVEADTARINRMIENWVRQAPAQYYWVHRRFKKRPPGQAKLY